MHLLCSLPSPIGWRSAKTARKLKHIPYAAADFVRRRGISYESRGITRQIDPLRGCQRQPVSNLPKPIKFIKSIPVVVLRKLRLDSRHHSKFRHRRNAGHLRRRCAPRPATTATSISLQIRRNCGNSRHLLGAADLGNNTPSSSVHATSACGRNPSA